MRMIVAGLLSLLLCQCNAVPSSIKKENLPNIKKIGCISLLGEEISWMNRPTSNFNSPEDLRPLSDWHLDASVTDLVEKQIRSSGRFEYVVPAYDAGPLNRVYSYIKSFPIWAYDIQKIQVDLKRIATQNSLDTLIVLVKALTEEDSMKVSGFGVYSTPYMLERDTRLFVLTRMVVIDVATMKPLAQRQSFDIHKIENKLWKKNFEDLTPEQESALRGKVVEALDKQIPTEMKKLGLVQ